MSSVAYEKCPSEASLPQVNSPTYRQHKAAKPLSLLPLIALIFFDVSGGPFGTEDAVRAGGPLLVIVGFIIFPLVWSVPEALITAEMATCFPENSGYVAWVTAAFGPFWGFQEGFWSWLSGVTDNSIYPVMLAANLQVLVPALADGWPRTVFVVGMSLLLTYLNYRGLAVVGNTALTTTLFILLPFLLLTAFSVPHINVGNWVEVDWSAIKWGTFLNVMFWNLNYWDSVSTLAGEVDQPHKTFPKALGWAVVLVVAFYLVPTMAALGVTTDMNDWSLGYYGKVAEKVGGRWLALWVVLAAAASQIGQFQAEMSSDSYQLQGMAERGFLPRALAGRSSHGTPTWGILLSALGVCCLAFFNFLEIVELLNAIYCLAELLEFAAFVWLRIKAPHLPRPYRIPLPTWGVILMLLPASTLLLVVLFLPFINGNWVVVGCTLAAMVGGTVLYYLLHLAKDRGWCRFAGLHFDFEHPLLQGDGAYRITANGSLTYDLEGHGLGDGRRRSFQLRSKSSCSGNAPAGVEDLSPPDLALSNGSCMYNDTCFSDSMDDGEATAVWVKQVDGEGRVYENGVRCPGGMSDADDSAYSGPSDDSANEDGNGGVGGEYRSEPV